jgi:hypothetical protein
MPRRIRQSPDSDVLGQKIVEDLEAALEQFREIANDLGLKSANPPRALLDPSYLPTNNRIPANNARTPMA